VNQLRQLMLEELRRRNFADTTIRCYRHGVTHFSRYFRRPPDQLGPEDIRKDHANTAVITHFNRRAHGARLKLIPDARRSQGRCENSNECSGWAILRKLIDFAGLIRQSNSQLREGPS
jgi:Phage integrase, N-terminal SAM-like domain